MEIEDMARYGSYKPKTRIEHSTSTSQEKENRWGKVDFGILQTIFKSVLINISDRASGVITILSSIIISVADIASDFAVAMSLFSSGHYTWGWIVVITDYVPSWQLAAHNSFSSKWRNIKSTKEKVITALFLLISPLSVALFNLRWMIKFETAEEEEFEYLHHNARLSHILNGSLESPAQIVILFVL